MQGSGEKNPKKNLYMGGRLQAREWTVNTGRTNETLNVKGDSCNKGLLRRSKYKNHVADRRKQSYRESLQPPPYSFVLKGYGYLRNINEGGFIK